MILERGKNFSNLKTKELRAQELMILEEVVYQVPPDK